MAMKRAMLAALLALSTSHAHAQAPSGQMTARVSAYCDPGTMRTGIWTYEGAVASDPAVVPLYSSLTIDGLPGTYTVLDTGGAVWGNRIDVFMTSCSRALEWGVREMEVRWWP